MPFEIERKYLVTKDWKEIAEGCESMRIRQGYLCRDNNCTVRIRIANNRGILTIKGKSKTLARPEYEYDVELVEAEELMQMTSGSIIEKIRYFVPSNGKTWELDVFSGDNEGLVVAELELHEEDEHIDMPDWVGEEVTEDGRYGNASLSRYPFKDWDADK
jgi:adenylate cyclase